MLLVSLIVPVYDVEFFRTPSLKIRRVLLSLVTRMCVHMFKGASSVDDRTLCQPDP